MSASSLAQASEPLLGAGDAVVTGFAGIRPSDALMLAGANPLDHFFINLEGPSAQIMSLGNLGGPPQGQLITPIAKRQILAKDVGQVFAIAIADPQGSNRPSIYLGATSAFGLNIVGPDADGNGHDDRLKTGAAGAKWMAGQFATDKGGSPGAIWKVDGLSGDATLFATLPDNSGPGVGDVVFDKISHQFFASDLDTGLIHRIGADGALIDTFDHGVDGRPAKGLAPMADDGSKADITSAAFDVTQPSTWGFTQKERMVYGMVVHDGRLYYAVNHQVYSIGIGADGSFSGDARWELDAADLAGDGPITDMLFDSQGRMYLAQRGQQRGSYDYGVFAEAEKSDVRRFHLEKPDDPATESRWAPEAEAYAIGMPPDHRHANGGIALGYDYDEQGSVRSSTCGEFLWSTGDRLRAGSELVDPAQDADVAGLQGNATSDVRPANVPPTRAYYADYDGILLDPEKAGHIGDVEIWQPCGAKAPEYGGYPPGLLPPGDGEPPGFPPEFPPPEWPYRTNLRLTKEASPKECSSWGASWVCRYNVFVTNTGPDAYFGPILVRDVFPGNPPGLATFFANQPPWTCWNVGGNPADSRCWRPNVFLNVGNSVQLTVWGVVPKQPLRCRLTNTAKIEWAPGGSPWNFDPADDFDAAAAIVPDPRCEPTNRRTNLELKKRWDHCVVMGGDVQCGFHITVRNTHPVNVFHGPIEVHDQMPAGVNYLWAPGFNWDCNVAAGTLQCKHKNPANVTLAPNGTVDLWVYGKIPVNAAPRYNCRLPNRAWIADPIGPPKNTNAADDSDGATAVLPAALCEHTPPRCPAGFVMDDGRCVPRHVPDPTPPRPSYPDSDPWDQPTPNPVCPANTIGKWPNCRTAEVCPADTTELSARRARQLRLQGWSVSRLKSGQWCGSPPIVTPDPVCPPHTVGKWPNCRKVDVCPGDMRDVPASRVYVLRRKGWTVLRLQSGKWCGKPGKSCPSGTKLDDGACVPVRVPCGPGFTGYKPNCTPIVHPCPRGMKRDDGRCVPIRVPCGSGFTGFKPNCKPIRIPCGRGFTGFKPHCKPIRVPCGPGFTGFKPNCKPIRIPCGRGFTGFKPNCKPIRVPCGLGFRGFKPNCKPISRPPQKGGQGSIRLIKPNKLGAAKALRLHRDRARH